MDHVPKAWLPQNQWLGRHNTSFFRNDALSSFNIDSQLCNMLSLQVHSDPLFHLVYEMALGNVGGLSFPCSEEETTVYKG